MSDYNGFDEYDDYLWEKEHGYYSGGGDGYFTVMGMIFGSIVIAAIIMSVFNIDADDCSTLGGIIIFVISGWIWTKVRKILK